MTDDIYCIKSVLEAGVHVNQKDIWGYSALRNYSKNCKCKSKDPAQVRVIALVATVAGENKGQSMKKHHQIQKKSDFHLQDLCRDVIRKNMAFAEPRVNLFCKIPQLPLPPRLKRFLLYDISLENMIENCARLKSVDPLMLPFVC